MSDNITETQEATITLIVKLDADYGSPLWYQLFQGSKNL